MKKSNVVTFAETAKVLECAAAPQAVKVKERKVTGLLVPFGQEGFSGLGQVTFSKGSIELPEDISRVKFLDAHDQKISLGEATRVWEDEKGLWVEFSVAEGEAGDRALADIASGARDGLSAGVRLSDATLNSLADQMWGDGPKKPVAADGRLLEGSIVSIPAFDDARADRGEHLLASAHGEGIAMFGWNEKEKSMVFPKHGEGAPERSAEQSTEQGAGTGTEGPATISLAAQTAATVTSEAPVYTFNGSGPSLVADLARAGLGTQGASEARERVARFNQALVDGDANAQRVMTAAVATRQTPSSAQFLPENAPIRQDLLLQEVDRGRPLTTAFASNFTLADATPFRVPAGRVKFNSVGDHVEGTAHVGEGVLTSTTTTLVEPGAISGAYRFSRELLDASNPAIDQMALQAMVEDYRRATESKTAAAIAAGGGSITYGIDTVQELRLQANAFYDLDDTAADFIIESSGFFAKQIGDVDTTGRPLLPYVGPANASGTVSAGYTGYSLDGSDVAKSNSLAANTALIARKSAMVVAESATRTFKFEEVEGPGVIKVALFGYFVAKVVDGNRIRRVSSAASA